MFIYIFLIFTRKFIIMLRKAAITRNTLETQILAVSDVEAKYYYDYYVPGKLREFDLIIACGDLRRSYLEFLATMARCPISAVVAMAPTVTPFPIPFAIVTISGFTS